MTNGYPFVVSVDEFKGKRVLVTGGTKGIGEAILRRFELSGATVATTARSEPAAGQARALFIKADIGTALGAQTVADRIQQEWGGLDVLVNNAGGTETKPGGFEEEVGAQLLTRSARGIQLTAAGRAFLEHARLVLLQVEAESEAARRVAHPSKPCFTMGFLTGHELKWMPEALRILRDELPNIDVMVTSQYSPLLADGLSNGKIDAAFLRREKGLPDLGFRLLVKEPLLVILPSNHRLAALKSIGAKDLEGEIFVTVSKTAPVLRAVIDEYLKRSGPISGHSTRRITSPWECP